MATPKGRPSKTVKVLIWDDANNEYKVWDGVLSAGDIEIGAIEVKDHAGSDRVAVTSNNDLQVTLDGEVIATVDSKASSAGTSTGVSVGSSSTTVLVSNSSRKVAIIVNDSDEDVYLKYGSGATSNSGIRLNAYGGSIVETVYTGIITGICASGSKTVTVTEM